MSTRAEGLFPACTGSRMHRQRQGLIGLTSSASRSALPPPSSTARMASSSPTVKALRGNPYDGQTLETVIPDMEALAGNTIARIFAEKRSRPQRAARLQVPDLPLRPKARGNATDQA